jgi:Zn-finger nucleic acid-binding protein
VDQCTECRGIFLDRGELEKLFEAESSYNSRQAPPSRPAAPAPQPGAYAPPPPPPVHGGGYAAPPPPAYGQPVAHGYPQAYGHHGHYRQHGHYRHRRQKSFLHELFD